MDDRVDRIQRRMFRVIQEEILVIQQEMQGFMNDLLKDALDPRRLLHFIRSMGVDASRLSGMMGQPSGFDPYQILGLDKSAGDEEVKKRYRELIHKLHPDTAGVEGTGFLLNMVLAAYNLIKMQRGWQ